MISTIHNSFPGHTQHVTSFIIVDTAFFITAGWDRSLISWSLEKKHILDVQIKHRSSIIKMCFFKKEKELFTLSKDNLVIKWKISSDGKLLFIRNKKIGNKSNIIAKEIYFDNKRRELFVFSSDTTIHLLTLDLKRKTIYNINAKGKFKKFIRIKESRLLLFYSNSIGIFNLKDKSFELISEIENISAMSTFYNEKNDFMILFSTYSGLLLLLNVRKLKIKTLLEINDFITIIRKRYTNNNKEFIIQTSNNIIFQVKFEGRKFSYKKIGEDSKRRIRTILIFEDWQLIVHFNNDIILKNENNHFRHLFKGYAKVWSFIHLDTKIILGLSNGSIFDTNSHFLIDKGPINAIEKLNTNDKFFVLSTGSGKILYLNQENFEIINSLNIHSGKIWNFKIYHESILTASNDKNAIYLTPDDNIYLEHDSSVNDSELIFKINKIITITDNGDLYIWSLSGDLIEKIKISKGILRTLAVIEKDTVAVIGSYDKKIYFFDIKNLKIVDSLNFYSLVLNVKLNLSETLIAIGTEDGQLRIVDTETHKTVSENALFNPIYDIKWINDDELFVLCSNGLITKHKIDNF